MKRSLMNKPNKLKKKINRKLQRKPKARPTQPKN